MYISLWFSLPISGMNPTAILQMASKKNLTNYHLWYMETALDEKFNQASHRSLVSALMIFTLAWLVVLYHFNIINSSYFPLALSYFSILDSTLFDREGAYCGYLRRVITKHGTSITRIFYPDHLLTYFPTESSSNLFFFSVLFGIITHSLGTFGLLVKDGTTRAKGGPKSIIISALLLFWISRILGTLTARRRW